MPLDLDALVLAPCHATFGEVNRGFPCPTWTPRDSSSTLSIDGQFRIESTNVLGLTDVPGLSTRDPEIDFRVSQFPSGQSPDQGDTVTARGVTYIVSDTRPDGNGLVTLSLREAAD